MIWYVSYIYSALVYTDMFQTGVLKYCTARLKAARIPEAARPCRAAAAMSVALFLGGGAGPWLPEVVWFAVKTAGVLAGLVAVGRRVPVLRPDRAVEVAWVVVIPLTLAQALVVAVLRLSGSYT